VKLLHCCTICFNSLTFTTLMSLSSTDSEDVKSLLTISSLWCADCELDCCVSFDMVSMI